MVYQLLLHTAAVTAVCCSRLGVWRYPHGLRTLRRPALCICLADAQSQAAVAGCTCSLPAWPSLELLLPS